VLSFCSCFHFSESLSFFCVPVGTSRTSPGPTAVMLVACFKPSSRCPPCYYAARVVHFAAILLTTIPLTALSLLSLSLLSLSLLSPSPTPSFSPLSHTNLSAARFHARQQEPSSITFHLLSPFLLSISVFPTTFSASAFPLPS